MIVAIEIIGVRRDPREAPTHTRLERSDLLDRRSRYHRQRDVSCGEVRNASVEMIGQQRATWASFRPAGTKHEVVHDELAFAGEQIGEGYLAVPTVEHIVLL